MAEESLESIFSRLNAEKKTGELLQLPVGFYKQCGIIILEKIKEEQKNNAQRMLDALVAKRAQKILVYAAYGRQLPQPVPTEDEDLYKKARELIGPKTHGKIKKIRIIAEVPELLTPGGRRLGPYSKNQIIETDNTEDLAYMLNNKIGETIN